ncbi:MAG: alpha/beta fold hydrolase [Candidatus Promineifilaceae bacterium]|nr:alpha/beta fold hydrolase [Candidatus Promineifilaceae bacterium]
MAVSVDYLPLPRSTVETLGIATSYYEAGVPTGTPLILLHGMSASADSFRELMHELADDYWLLAPDIPGFGRSGDLAPYTFARLVEWLAAFVEALDLPPAHLVGHSFGGALSVSFARAVPERARRLILLAPSVLQARKFPPWMRSFGETVLAEKVLELGVSLSRLWLDRQIRAAFHEPERFPDSLWERRIKDYEMARASAAVLKASAVHDMLSELAAITHPTCIIWGESDPVLEPADALTLAKAMQEAPTSVHMLAACGHIPHIEQQDAVVHFMRDFLAQDRADTEGTETQGERNG